MGYSGISSVWILNDMRDVYYQENTKQQTTDLIYFNIEW